MARAIEFDEEVLQQSLWKGKIPVKFTLDPTEVTTLHPPRPIYAMLPRMNYLVCETRNVIEYFSDATPPLSSLPGMSIWFEHNGIPLKWHLPLGVLYDLYGKRENEHLPWHIVVHFQGFPVQKLLPCENEKAVETHYMHSLKQATFLRLGTTKSIMALPEAQQMQIWKSVKENDLNSFNQAIKEVYASGDVSAQEIRHIPLRILLRNEPTIQLPIIACEKKNTTSSDNIEEKSLKDVLSYLLPDLFPTQSNTTQVIIHGVQVPLNLSLAILYRIFRYPDGFLYLCVIPNSG